MDRSRMDAEGGRVLHPNKRVRKLAVVVAVQNLLVIVCLLVTFYLYWDFQTWISKDIVHIQFEPTRATPGNTTVQFLHVRSKFMMDLNKQKDQIYIECTGFYIWHMYVCYKSLTEGEKGTLQLRVVESETPVSSFTLNDTREVCRGLHSIIYLKRREQASLHLFSKSDFRIKNMTVGMSYLQGKECVY